MAEPIVAIALLTQNQLNWLGGSLKKVYPIQGTDRFNELLQALDAMDAQSRS